jgi:hypothetical protein
MTNDRWTSPFWHDRHSLVRAKERGFRAMQFNFVVSTNERAIKTWEAYGL